MKLQKIFKCPVCHSSSYRIAKNGYKNMYSEQISAHLKMPEKKLIKELDWPNGTYREDIGYKVID